MKTKHKKAKKSALLRNRDVFGYVFVAPFAIGFVLFILIPIIQSIVFSLSNIELTTLGYSLEFVGLDAYKRALFVDTEFRRLIVNALVQTFTELPVVLSFSFFAAILLNQKFKGRAIARAIFFLPVIMSSGLIATIDGNNPTLATMMTRNTADMLGSTVSSFSANKLITTFFENGIPPAIMEFIAKAIDRIDNIIVASGLQIVIFLSGLNTISPSLFEASDIEGATAWENFWKITFPMMGPYILLNAIYTIVDSFTNVKNPLIAKIQNFLSYFQEFSFGLAISWIYFFIIFAVLAIVFPLISKKVFYHD